MARSTTSHRARALALLAGGCAALVAACVEPVEVDCRARRTTFDPKCEPALCPADLPRDGDPCPIPEQACYFAFQEDCMVVRASATCVDSWEVDYTATCVCEATTQEDCQAVIGCGWWEGACHESVGCEGGESCPWLLECVTRTSWTSWDGEVFWTERSFCVAPGAVDPW